MKLSVFATFTLLLALPACGEDKDDTDTDSATATMTATAPMTGTDGTSGGTTTGDGTGEATTTETTAATDETGTTAAPTGTTAEPTGTTAEPTTGGATETTGSAGSSFATDVWAPILESQCGCHQAGAAGGLLLGPDADSAYAAMVGVASSKGMNYVTPGDPDASYMFHKLEGTQGEVGGGGAQMPLGAPALDPAQIAAIEAWIADGANK